MRPPRQVWWAIILILLPGATASGNDAQRSREGSRSLDFEIFQIDLLPVDFTVSEYRLTSCVRAPDTPIDVVEARVEDSDGKKWADVYQLHPPKEGGSVSCAAVELNVQDYCHRSAHPESRACSTVSYGDSKIKAHRARPDPSASFRYLYTIIEGTLVVFAFDHKMTWEEIRQALEAMESMKRVTLGDLLSYRPEWKIAGKLWSLREALRTPTGHIDQIPFSKFLPDPRPGGFDRIQGYAYWDGYVLEFQSSSSQDQSHLRMTFSEAKRSPRATACWSGQICVFVATTPRGRRIYSSRNPTGSGGPQSQVREYYANIEGTLVTLSWSHSARSGGKRVFRSHEFVPDELETLIDSLEEATSFEVAHFPNMQVMGTYGGAGGGRLSSKHRIIEASGHSIEVLPTAPVETPVKTDCIRYREDGSIDEIVGNIHRWPPERIPRCDP